MTGSQIFTGMPYEPAGVEKGKSSGVHRDIGTPQTPFGTLRIDGLSTIITDYAWGSYVFSNVLDDTSRDFPYASGKTRYYYRAVITRYGGGTFRPTNTGDLAFTIVLADRKKYFYSHAYDVEFLSSEGVVSSLSFDLYDPRVMQADIDAMRSVLSSRPPLTSSIGGLRYEGYQAHEDVQIFGGWLRNITMSSYNTDRNISSIDLRIAPIKNPDSIVFNRLSWYSSTRFSQEFYYLEV